MLLLSISLLHHVILLLYIFDVVIAVYFLLFSLHYLFSVMVATIASKSSICTKCIYNAYNVHINWNSRFMLLQQQQPCFEGSMVSDMQANRFPIHLMIHTSEMFSPVWIKNHRITSSTACISSYCAVATRLHFGVSGKHSLCHFWNQL